MPETATYTDWDLEGGLPLGWNSYNLEDTGYAVELCDLFTDERSGVKLPGFDSFRDALQEVIRALRGTR